MNTINGQRVNDTHDYVLDGTNIVRELITHTVGTGGSATTTTKTLYYLYDAPGSVAGLIYNGNVYYFQKNIQGDIIRICNAGGDTVVEYTYDAWGKVLSVTGTMASTLGQDNPFRYRGYYYDSETGFYYLQTRYYDPEVGRFLNADVIIGANGDIEGYNSFAYCSNNPVVGFDPLGQWTISFGFSFSLGFFTNGYTFSFGIVADSEDHWGIEYSYSSPKSEEMENTSFGLSMSIGGFVQVTNYDSIESRNKEKESWNVGVNTPVVGVDAVLDSEQELKGVTVCAGPTMGGDFHINKSTTSGIYFDSIFKIICKSMLGD